MNNKQIIIKNPTKTLYQLMNLARKDERSKFTTIKIPKKVMDEASNNIMKGALKKVKV